MKQLFSDLYNILTMLLAAFVSFFFALLFKGGPTKLYDSSKFSFSKFLWIFSSQFFGSICVFLLVFLLCTPGGFFEQYSSHGILLAFLFAILPIELTMIFLIIAIHRLWLVVIRKIDPNFDEGDPFEKIKSVLEFTEDLERRTAEETKRMKKDETSE